ncbi:CHASE domain-containing protein [Cytophagaceae bacterium ABcell3]|nr:CHASE domain-containing protein [Cytophagaceae bacterium ABcell3]
MNTILGNVLKTDFLPSFSSIIVLLITLFSFWYLQSVRDERRNVFFQERSDRAEMVVEKRMIDYNQILLGAKGFIEESDTVTHEEWRNYYKTLDVNENYPGIQGIGHSIFIAPDELEDHIRFMRHEGGFSNYKITPKDERSVYTSIIYLEPLTLANQRAIGYDMFSEPVRREAMKRARDSGTSALSGKVTLVQEAGADIQPGFLLYVPVYENEGRVITNVSERRAKTMGYVYSPFRAFDLFNAILMDRFQELSIQIYDGENINDDALLYQKKYEEAGVTNSTEDLEKISQLQIYGSTWTIRYASAGFMSRSEQNLPYFVLFGGIAFSILIFFIMVFHGRSQIAKRAAMESVAARNFIIEAMPEKVSLTDKQGNFTYVNKKWKNYTGLPSEGFTFSNLKSIVHPDDRDKTESIYKECYASGKSFTIEHRLKRKDGVYRWHLTLVTARKDKSGNLISWMATHIDIHEQKSQMEELKKTNSDLDNFVYTASHDLRAPISNMEGLLHTVYDETKEQCSSDVTVLFDMINVSIQRLKNTISDLTEISRIQREYENQEEKVNIQMILDEFKQDHKDLIEQNNATITTDLPIQEIRFSRKHFRSILYNLVSNAIKYSSPDRDPKVFIRTEQTNGNFILSVSDNGLGLTEEQEEKIFDMFKRLHTHVEGTGIGLYIVKRIVENAEGKIEVNSKAGEGTEFKITLPLNSTD